VGRGKGLGIELERDRLLDFWVDANYSGSLFVSLLIFYIVYFILMLQMHCKIINLKKINYGLIFPT
jgi:hypothetical protein